MAEMKTKDSTIDRQAKEIEKLKNDNSTLSIELANSRKEYELQSQKIEHLI